MAKKQEYKTFEVPIDEIKPSPRNPRKTFDEEQLSILRESIGRHDMIEPILVRKETWEIIDGERRWRAEKAAGKTTVQVRVYDVDEYTANELRLTAQMQRLDLNDREKEDALYDLWIEGYKVGRYVDQRTKKPSKAIMARAVGTDGSTISKFILAKEERLGRTPHSDILQKAAVDDLKETRPLEKVDPEARVELLKQREADIITQQELREITSIIAEASRDLRLKIAKREITPEDAKDAVESFAEPEERATYIERKQLIREQRDKEEANEVRKIKQNVDDVKHNRPPTYVTVDISEQRRNEHWVDKFQNTYWDVYGVFQPKFIGAVTNAKMREECINYVQKTMNLCSAVLAAVQGEIKEVISE